MSFSFSFRSIANTNAGVFLPLCTNFMTTTSLSYRIWKETRYCEGLAPSLHNKTRLRRIAVGLVETGFIYFAVQLSYTVTTAMILYEDTYSGHPSVDVSWAWNVTNPLNAMIPVHSLVYFREFAYQVFITGNSYDAYCRQDQCH